MNILIVGCGKVGSRLATVLSARGHDISIVNRTDDAFDLLPSNFNGFTTIGVPIDQEVLKKAGIESCDIVCAVTQEDNMNIMVCELARKVFNVPKVIVRVNDPRRDEVFSTVGMDTICPTNLTVSAVTSALESENENTSINLGVHTLSFTTMDIPKSFIGLTVSEIEFEEDEVLYAIQKENGNLILVGLNNMVLSKGDKLVFSKMVD